MNCIILDDEKMAVEILENYVKKVPFLNLLESFTDAIKALDYLKLNHVDLLILDINMPDINGLSLLEMLDKTPLIIFTTAYPEFALKSYEYATVDYLLKPFAFDKFLKAAYKAEKLHLNNLPNLSTEKKILYIKSATHIYSILEDDIMYIKGSENYLTIVSEGKELMCLKTLKEILTELDPYKFIRVHKSYIVALSKIEKIEPNAILINGKKIPIGKSFKADFVKRITHK